MKRILTILFLFVSLLSRAGTYHITFPSSGHLDISQSNGYVGGDIVYIGKGTTILPANEDNMTIDIHDINNIHPWDGNGFVTFMWEPGETPLINNSSWDGGSFSSGLRIFNSQRIRFLGTPSAYIKILGGTNDATRQNSFDVELNHLTYKIEVAYLDIHDGGTGVQMKTEATSDSLTWFGRTNMDSCHLHHIDVTNSGNEAFYLGSTSMFIKVAGSSGVGTVQQNNFCTDALPDTVVNGTSAGYYKRTLVYHKVTVNDCMIFSSAGDAYQFAAMDSLTVFKCFATGWASFNAEGHKWGLLLGGRCTNTWSHDIILKNSLHGDGIAVFSMGPDNLLQNILLDSTTTAFNIFIKQGDAGLCGNNSAVTIEHFTQSRTLYSPLFRVTPNMGATADVIVRNCLSASNGPDPGFGVFVDYWSESTSSPKHPGYSVATGSNQSLHFSTIVDAQLDVTNYMQKLPGSPVDDEGYQHDPSWLRLGGAPVSNFHYVKKVSIGTNIKLKR